MAANYLIEIKALDDWELTHPLSANAYKVMRKLQYLANLERFPERISVPNTVLMSLVGCSEDSLIKARNQLIQAGLIAYMGKKKATPVYTIAYFSDNPVYNSKLQGYKQCNEQGYEQGYKQGNEQGYEQGHEQGTIINEIKGEETEEEAAAPSAVAYMERCRIPMSAPQYEAIRDFYEMGITDDMLRYAADEAVEYGARSFAYVRRVVDGWICEGVKTLEEARARKGRFQDAQRAQKAGQQARAQEQSAQAKPRFFSERWAE